MAIIKKTIQNLHAGTQYLLTVKATDGDLNTTLDPSAVIRFTTPADASIPTELGNLIITANYQSIMISFNPSDDLDFKAYEYKVFTDAQIELVGSLYQPLDEDVFLLNGFSASNVITLDVPETSTVVSIDSETNVAVIDEIYYYVKIRTVDTTGNTSAWTRIQRSGQIPLIESAHIRSLAANQITAGTIGAHEISLGGIESIIKSNTYNSQDATPSGWFIRGDGHLSFGGPNGINYNGSTVEIGTAVNVKALSSSSSISVGSGSNHLSINDAINAGAGGLTAGDPSYNFWYSNGRFRVGNDSKYIYWDGTSNFDIVGDVTIGSTAASVLAGRANSALQPGQAGADVNSGSTNISGNKIRTGSISSNSGSRTINLDTGDINFGNFTVDSSGNAAFTGYVNAASGYIAGININAGRLYAGAGNWANPDTGFYLDLNGYFSLRDQFYFDANTGIVKFKGTLDGASGILGGALEIGASCKIGDNLRVNNPLGDGGVSTVIIKGGGSTDSTASLKLVDSGDTVTFRMKNNGDLYVRNSITVGTTAVSLNGHTHNYAATTHTHSYLSSNGGTLSGSLVVGGNITGQGYITFDQTLTSAGIQKTTAGNVGVIVFDDQNAATGKRVYWKAGTGSSIRFKENIQPIVESVDNLKNFWNLEPILFEYKPNYGGDLKEERPYGFRKHYGFIAEEVEELVPYLVSYDDDSLVDDVKYDSVFTVLYSEVKKMRQWLIDNYNYPG